MSMLSTNQETTTHWVGRFFAINILLMLLISLSYVSYIPNVYAAPLTTMERLIDQAFVILACIGQMGLGVFLTAIVAWLLAVLVRKNEIVISISIIMVTILTWVILLDRVTFHVYHAHSLELLWEMVRVKALQQTLALSSSEWYLVGGTLVVTLLFELLLAWGVLRWVQSRTKLGYAWLSVVVLSLSCLLLSYLLISFPVTQSLHVMLSKTRRIVPYYYYPQHKPKHHNRITVKKRSELNYPLHASICTPQEKPLNIVFIVIDSWRYDMLNKKTTPNIENFSQHAWRFMNHFSGGDGTQPGIFSLLYGIPSNYWDVVKSRRREPELFKQLQKADYQLKILSSASVRFPAFDKTAFHGIDNIDDDPHGLNSTERDREITRHFQQFINTRDRKKPFMSFVFYNEVHNYCESEQDYRKPFKPTVTDCNRGFFGSAKKLKPYFNRYKNAVHFVDSQVGKVIQSLREQNLLDNTIVVITSDHGEEFGESHKGAWGHANAFNRYQVKVPLVVYWPQQRATRFIHRTSHYDIAPTLMRSALGCKNPSRDYSVGQHLLNRSPRNNLVVNSYSHYAILHEQRITTVYPGGLYEVSDLAGKTKASATPQPEAITAAKEILVRYKIYTN